MSTQDSVERQYRDPASTSGIADKARSTFGSVADTANATIGNVGQAASDAWSATKTRATAAMDGAAEHVGQRPFQSVGMALVIGVALGYLLGRQSGTSLGDFMPDRFRRSNRWW